MTVQVNTIAFNNPVYPSKLQDSNLLPPPHKIWAIGNIDILQHKLLGFFCSTRCPGDIILKTYDLARSWRDNGTVVIGGFHSPMEKECLDFLLRGTQPLVICPARGIEHMRIPKVWRKSLAEGRLLVVSPFPNKHRRPTLTLGVERNTFVAALAEELFVPYAHPGGKVAQLLKQAMSLGKKVSTYKPV
ncbi:MAG: DNA-processing protein DprA [Desulfobacterales bacterium]|nr:DNA-processing protein DprA [Desulfobacterales bacterium]